MKDLESRKSEKLNLRQGILLPLLFLCLLLTLMGCGNAGSSLGTSGRTPTGSSTLRVGVRSRISGFGYLNENTGKFSGLEIDIAQDMARRIGYNTVEFLEVTPETRVEMLTSGEIDCVLACYSITEEQKEFVDFSPAYYEDYSIVMVENTSLFNSIEDLTGHGYTLGTVAGTNTASQLVGRLCELGLTDGELLYTNEDGSLDAYDNFNIAYIENYQVMDDLLEMGRIDALCADGCIARTYLYPDRHILDFTISSQSYGAATLKGSALSGPVAAAISEMLDDGTIDAYIDKWD